MKCALAHCISSVAMYEVSYAFLLPSQMSLRGLQDVWFGQHGLDVQYPAILSAVSPCCLDSIVLSWVYLQVAIWKMRQVTDSSWSLRALGIWSICNPKQQKLKGGQPTGSVANRSSSAISSVNHENCWTWQQQRLLGDDFIFKLPVQSGSKAGQETPRSFWMHTLVVQGEVLTVEKKIWSLQGQAALQLTTLHN